MSRKTRNQNFLVRSALCVAPPTLATVHVNKTKNADKIFPRAMLLTIIIVILTMGLGSLGVAMIIPHDQLQLICGAMQHEWQLLVITRPEY